jgi:UDP-N-acetylmuramoylalanine-D-glutamate ligase
MNTSGKDVCPICNTQDKKQVVLIIKSGTQEGNIAQAVQVHLDCLNLIYDEENQLIYQRVVKITKEQFERYEEVRKNGRTNMLMITNVMDLSGLSKEEVLEIMNNYSKLKRRFEL